MRDYDSLEITRTEGVDASVARGRILWDSIYEPHAVKLHDKLSSYHPDFMGEYTHTHFAGFLSVSPLYFFVFRFFAIASVQQPRSTLHTPLPCQRPVSR